MNNWLLLAILPSTLFAQISDNFSDGDFTNKPTWSGSVAQFIINGNQQLQLNNTLAGTSWLSTPFATSSLDNQEWQIFVKQNFSPSAGNFGRVYLVSDHSDLSSPLNGYYLQFGESGSNDAIELFRQSGSTSVSVCRASSGLIATAFNVRIKVTRDSSGLWSLLVDYSGNTDFSLETAGIDSTYTTSSFMGILCTYTISNATRFYFDDIYAGPAVRDVIPPVLEWAIVKSSHQLLLGFSELLDTTSSQRTFAYQANNNLGNPLSASLQPNGTTVLLTFSGTFGNGIQNQISVSGIKDLSGNTMATDDLPFLYFVESPVSRRDMIITEILPDPDPPIGLPPSEFVEIYNRSPNPIQVNGWVLTDGTSSAIISSAIILPSHYWIVTGAASQPAYSLFGNAIGAGSFPALNNNGDYILLKSADGISIDSVNYSTDYYHDADKAGGGWSLELIDRNNPCGGEGNWAASEDPAGGTPGKQNSVDGIKPDLTGPRLTGVIPRGDSLLISFDERLDIAAPAEGSFQLTPLLPISGSSFADLSLDQILVVTSEPMKSRQAYQLKVTGVRDCNNNLIQDDYCQLNFALPEPADTLDVVINEVLFNPRPAGVDFVEIYNCSEKYLNLKGWKLANVEGSLLKDAKPISSGDLLLAPAAYLVFTADPDQLASQYPMGVLQSFVKTMTPSLPDDEGSVAIAKENGKMLDAFHYSKDFHTPLIRDDEGVSLERISSTDPTNDPQNWRSATSQSGFATPGYLNSNARPEIQLPAGDISVEPEIFVPGLGGNDFALIHYSFQQAGLVANIKIYDAIGRLVRNIANNEILGFEGFYRWDGVRDDGTQARVGYYLVWGEVFDFSGTVRAFRKRVIIAYR